VRTQKKLDEKEQGRRDPARPSERHAEDKASLLISGGPRHAKGKCGAPEGIGEAKEARIIGPRPGVVSKRAPCLISVNEGQRLMRCGEK
jgi:hypothetical protein